MSTRWTKGNKTGKQEKSVDLDDPAESNELGGPDKPNEPDKLSELGETDKPSEPGRPCNQVNQDNRVNQKKKRWNS